MGVVETIICGVYSILHQLNGGVEKIYFEQYNRIEYVCNQSPNVQYIHAANYLYIFALMTVLCFFSFKNRSTHKVFKESRCPYFGSFFSLFVFLVVVIFNVVVYDINIIITIQSGAMLIALCVVWALFYGIRMFKFFMYPEDRMVVKITATPNRSKHDGMSVNSTQQTQPPHTEMNGMPSYINALYKQRGFESTTKTPNDESVQRQRAETDESIQTATIGNGGIKNTNKGALVTVIDEGPEQDGGHSDDSSEKL